MATLSIREKTTRMSVREHSWIVDPYEAIYRNVLPFVSNQGWLEDSSKRGDTNLSSREWAGLAATALSFESFFNKYYMVGTDERNGDGLISPYSEKPNRSAMFVEQTLATERSGFKGINAVEEAIKGKAKKQYEEGTHLIVWANIDVELDGNTLHEIMESCGFGTVSVIAMDGDTLMYFTHVHGLKNYQECKMNFPELLQKSIEQHKRLVELGKVAP